MTDEKHTITTSHGHSVNVQTPEPATLVIEDVAHALSNLCRFGGHGRRFYSVAEHSLYTATLITRRLRALMLEPWCVAGAIAALLHDAAEAYLVDIPRPVKTLLPMYGELEARMLEAIRQRFVPWAPNFAAEVKVVDDIMLVTEAPQLEIDMANWSAKYQCITPCDITLSMLTPSEAEPMFLDVYHSLMTKQQQWQAQGMWPLEDVRYERV